MIKAIELMLKHYELIKSFILFALVSYINGFLALNVINPLKTSPPLYDVGFNTLPHISANIPNYMLIGICIYYAQRIFRGMYISELISTLQHITVLFAMRMLSFVLTIVPPATQDCYSREIDEPYEWNVLRYLVLENDNTCIDYMFSGHAVYFLTIWLSILRLSRDTNEKILISIYAIVGIMGIIASHIHYTADVLIATFLTLYTEGIQVE